MNKLKHIWVLAILLFAVSCSDDDDAPKEKPSINFEGTTAGVYTIKLGSQIKLSPTIKNAENPKYTWMMDEKTVGTDLSYTFSATKVGEYIITFYLKSNNGDLKEEIIVDVLDKTIPVISFALPEEGYLSTISEGNLEIEPRVKFGDNADYIWKLNSKEVSKEKKYTFNQKELGDYNLELTVSNSDGTDTKSVTIKVVEKSGIQIIFPAKNMTVPLGKSLTISPIVENNVAQPIFTWKVNDVIQEKETSETFKFTPTEKVKYTITLMAKDGSTTVSESIIVECVAEEGTYYRKATTDSKVGIQNVYNFTPAPGQFVNENYTANTPEEASAYALKMLKDGKIISLGAFGGYVVVGFDHSIDNIGNSTDFDIVDNAFSSFSEPGIVWVMQDENGNGLPDDTWFELKGSEYGKKGTIQNYSVTYFRPSAPGMDVMWEDSKGKTGYVDYLKAFHRQDYYYPNWIKENSYTLYGTYLESQNVQEGGIWVSKNYDWGYADNFEVGRKTQSNSFDIDNVIYPNGDPANLKYIDFVKVQTGVNAKSGMLGEISTEISAINDTNLNK